MKRHAAVLAAGVFTFLVSSLGSAGTPNTTAAGAVSYEVGAGWVTDGVDESSQSRYFIFTELAGRSYCVEASLGPASYLPLDPSLTLYTDTTGSTVYLSNTNGAGEPPMYRGARVCYDSALGVGASTQRLFSVNVPVTAGSGDSGFVRARVVDTTLVLPMICLNDRWTLYISNTTTVDINAAVYVPGYGNIKTFKSTNTPANPLKAPNQPTGTGGVTASGFGLGGLTWKGAVYIKHDGPPGALEVWADTDDNCGSTSVRVYANPR